MARPAVDNVVDVALWFTEQARKDDLYLQPQKLHRLLYLAQGYYAAAFAGRKLMPATFVAQETGPIEPNVYRLFDGRRPDIDPKPLKPEVENFLTRLWRKHAHHSTEYLNEGVATHTPFRMALRRGAGEELSHRAMAIYFVDLVRDGGKPKVQPGQVLRTQDGRTLQKWVPTAKPVPRMASKTKAR